MTDAALAIIIFLGSFIAGWTLWRRDVLGSLRLMLPGRRRVQARPDYRRIAELERELGIGAPEAVEVVEAPPRPASALPFLPQRPYR